MDAMSMGTMGTGTTGMGTTAIPATFVRGGTSRALVFRREDLPADRGRWPAIFAAALGSPDPHGYQVDGLGGGVSSLSKVAVVSASDRAGCDVDYDFHQVEPKSGRVLTRANCGNISAAIGPFALAAGLVGRTAPRARVVIHNLNSDRIIEARFPVDPGPSDLIAIDGVPGTAPGIDLRFRDPGGAVTGRLFPTGQRREPLRVDGLGTVEVTMIDATVPTVIVRAEALGLAGTESPSALAGRPELVAAVERLRVAAGLRMGISDDPAQLRGDLANMPDVAIIGRAGAGAGDFPVRFFSSGAPHRAAPVTASIALAAARSLQGTLCDGAASSADDGRERAWTLDHPTGRLVVRVVARAAAGIIESASVMRTARLLFEGRVLIDGRAMPAARATAAAGAAQRAGGPQETGGPRGAGA